MNNTQGGEGKELRDHNDIESLQKEFVESRVLRWFESTDKVSSARFRIEANNPYPNSDGLSNGTHRLHPLQPHPLPHGGDHGQPPRLGGVH